MSEQVNNIATPLTRKQRKAADKLARKKNHVKGDKAYTIYLAKKALSSIVWPLFRFFILLGLCFVILYPLMYMISCAIRPQLQMSDPTVNWIPRSVIFTNFTDVIEIMEYWKALWTTLSVHCVSAVIQVGTTAITGYGFARFKFKGRGLLFGIVILSIIVPPQLILIPQFLQFRDFTFFGLTAPFGYSVSLYNTPWAMYVPALFANGIRSGLFILIFRQFFKGLPKELEDAAYLDGCGPLKTFIRVMVPNAGSAFLTVFLFSIVWYWNDTYTTTMFYSKGATVMMLVPQLSWKMTSVAERLPGSGGVALNYVVWIEAGALLAILPVLIMYIVLQKYFTEGIARSGLVG